MAASEEDGKVWLEVDDRDAVWPVTIDPSFTQQQKLEVSDVSPLADFGGAVAISGDTVVVGAVLASGAVSDDQGAAYVFVRSSGGAWTQMQKVEASDADAVVASFFGNSVAISGDTVVIGAPNYHGAAGFGQGAAYVFVCSSGIWSEQQKLLASDPGPFQLFGDSVAISGETVVVGASFGTGAVDPKQGTAYVFVRSGAVWSEQQKLEAPDAAANVRFGNSVAISGETVVVGAFLAAGAAGPQQGAAYVFVHGGPVWTLQQKLAPSDAEAGDQFGSSVALSGKTLMVGAQGDRRVTPPRFPIGSVYVFTPANAPPAITASNVSRTQDLPASISSIAQVNDAEDPLNILTVTVNDAASATVNGVTVSSISVDASGQVTAGVSAACGASDASFTLRVTDSGGLFAEATLNVTVTPETTPPLLMCPSNVVVTLPPNTTDTQMVVNYPAPSATDNCTASPIVTTSQASGTVFPVGLTTVNVTATDAVNNQAMCSFTVTVRYNFSGFFQPVDNPPTVNVVNAGRAIPVKFSLSGDKGLNIFAAGYPASQQIACSDGAPASEIEQMVTAVGSSLSYDAESDTYTYVWKTEESWAGTCRQLIVRLNDGSERVAFFKFR
jgi:hypothetical protein